MMQRALTLSRQYRRRGGVYAQRAVGGFALLVMHEFDALARHGVELRERMALARQASGLGELIGVQVDLLAETRARLSMDHRERRALLHSWVTDLSGGLKEAA